MINIFSFIRLADYLIVGTLHVLAVNSVQSLFNYYTEQLENTPSLADIQATNKMPEKTDEDGKPEEKPSEKKEISSLKKETTMSIPMHPGQVYII
jgi:dynein heavy chain